MYKLFNVHLRETNENKFLDRTNADEEACVQSGKNFGAIIVIDDETGEVVSIWNNGRETYGVY